MSEFALTTSIEGSGIVEPGNHAAEEELIGGLLAARSLGLNTCTSIVEGVTKIVTPDDFDRPSNRAIFAAQVEAVANGRPCDLLVTAEVLREREQFDQVGGEVRLRELAASAAGFTNAAHHAHLVRGAASRRAQFRLADRLRDAALNGGMTDDLREQLRRVADDVTLDAGGKFELEITTALELCGRPDPPGGGHLVGPLVMKASRTIIGGNTGDGKTTFALALVAAYVNKTSFLGFTGVGGRALMLDLEQGERTAKLRLQEAGLDKCEAVDYALIPDGLALDTEANQRAALDRVFVAGGYGIVLLDPHYKAHQGDVIDEQEVKRLMAYLDRSRAEHGFALILPTHGRKPPAAGAGKLTIHDVASGSGAIVRGAEIVLAVAVDKPGLTRLHVFKHRDGDDELPVHGEPWTLTFSRHDGYRRLATKPGPRKAPAEDIADWIRDQGGRASPGELRDHFNIAESTLRDRRPQLAELGIEYRGIGTDAEYVDNTSYPAPRAYRGARKSRGQNRYFKPKASPPPRAPATENAAGQETACPSQNSPPRDPALPIGSSPPTAGSGLPTPADPLAGLSALLQTDTYPDPGPEPE